MTLAMRYFLGADQGGTKTHIAVCAGDGAVIGHAAGEAMVFYIDDPENASTATIRRLAQPILTQNNLCWDDVTAVCGGISGIDWPFEIPLHEERLRDGLGIPDAVAVNDCMIALRAGASAPNRAIVCSGTSLNIGLRAADGREIIYSYLMSDLLMRGGTLGLSALDAAIEASVGVRAQTVLTDVILTHTGYTSITALVEDMSLRKYWLDSKHLVPGVLRCASEGDPAALEIVYTYADEIAKYIKAGLIRLEITEADVVFSGGALKGDGRIICDRIAGALSFEYPGLRFTSARLEPVCGALLLLLDRHYDGAIPEAVTARFERDCEEKGLLRS